MVKPNGVPKMAAPCVRFDIVVTIPEGVVKHRTHVQTTKLLAVDRVHEEGVRDLLQTAATDLLEALDRVTLDDPRFTPTEE